MPSGAGASAGETSGVRAHAVAVLFADMVGSTAANERLGDVAWNAVRERCLDAMRTCVSAQGGQEVSCQGDGLFARFDSADAAVRAAVAMQQWSTAGDAGGVDDRPELHIGVHAGQALQAGQDLVGNMVNVAARVTAVAAAGEILVTEPVCDLAIDGTVFEDRGMFELKGVSRPRHLLAVTY